MDTETVGIMTIIFGTPVAIVAIVCTYNLLKHWIDRKTAQPFTPDKPKAGQASTDELTLRAANLQKRLSNLEEILNAEKTEVRHHE